MSLFMRCQTKFTERFERAAHSPRNLVSPLMVKVDPFLPLRVGGGSMFNACATVHPSCRRKLSVECLMPTTLAHSGTVRLTPLAASLRSVGRGDNPITCSGVHSRWNRLWIVLYGIPVSVAQSFRTWVRPSTVRNRFRRVFRDCSGGVAHRQLLLVYGPLLFLRSRLCSSLKGWPISAKKFSKVRQRLHTVIPRPPYLWNDAHFGLRTLWSMLAQIVYTRVPCKPCVAPLPLREQPQDIAPWSERRIFSTPQSQRHSQRYRLCRRSLDRPRGRTGVIDPILVG